MYGLVTAAAAAALAVTVARVARLVGPPRLITDVLIVTGSALAAYAVATALDFGGWQVFDWRAATFTFLVSLASAGIPRLLRTDAEASPREIS